MRLRFPLLQLVINPARQNPSPVSMVKTSYFRNVRLCSSREADRSFFVSYMDRKASHHPGPARKETVGELSERIRRGDMLARLLTSLLLGTDQNTT